MSGPGQSRTTRTVRAPREAVYQAFLDPIALATWMAPGDMIGVVHAMDPRPGGGYEMSLYYPADDSTSQGKTGDREDRYAARFIELSPPSRIVEAINFDTTDPGFTGEMIMTITLESLGDDTEVTIAFDNLPAGVRPEDNDAGTQSSLEKLAQYVE